MNIANRVSENIVARIIFRLKNQGIWSLVKTGLRKFGAFIKPPRIKNYKEILAFVSQTKGLEIGGPSYVFSRKGFIPIYSIAKNLDNLNFSNETIWEGRIVEQEFEYGQKKLGRQFIREAIDLHGIQNDTYDFIISSEMIQHIANPLKALYEWWRVLKTHGYIILIVPNKEKTFDHKRPVTDLDHIIQDFENNTQETDLTHLPEALALHDLGRDMAAGSFEEFKKRSENNHKFRALHHHIFDENGIKVLVEYAGYRIISSDKYLATIIIVAKKIK